MSLLPTGSARYALSEATSLRLAYSRRITRPFIDYLNPFVFQVDPKNSSFGNSELAPELTNSYELGYATTIKTATVSATGSVRHTGNAIEQIRLPTADPSVTAQTYANAAATTFYQFSLFGSLKPTAQWDVSVGADAQFITRRSAFLGTSRRGTTAVLNLNTAYRFPKKLTVQAFVYGAFPIPELQGYSSANVYYTIGAKKTVRDHVDFTLTVINPFNAYFPYRSRINTAYFDEHTEFRLYLRAVRADISYRFGQAQQSRPRKPIRNDDQKGGSSKAGG